MDNVYTLNEIVQGKLRDFLKCILLHIQKAYDSGWFDGLQQVEIAIQLSSGKAVGGILFAADFVGISDSKESLQKLIDFVYSKWRLRANVRKSAMMFFF